MFKILKNSISFTNRNCKILTKICNSHLRTNLAYKRSSINKQNEKLDEERVKNPRIRKKQTENENVFVFPKCNENVYHIDDFFYRVNSWEYDWLLRPRDDSFRQYGEIPPIIDKEKELFPIVDAFKSYDEYFKTMFPLLLLETWEKITEKWKNQIKTLVKRNTNLFNQKKKSIFSLKEIKNIDNKKMHLIFQSNLYL